MLQEESTGYHERASTLVEMKNQSSRSGMLEDIALMLGRQFAVYNNVNLSLMAEKLMLPLIDLKALELIVEFGALPTGHLAKLLGVSSGGVTALITRLETAGFVQRGRAPLDRRMIVIRPIEHACEQLFQERQGLGLIVSILAARYDVDQLDSIHAFLAQSVNILRKDTQAWLATQHQY